MPATRYSTSWTTYFSCPLCVTLGPALKWPREFFPGVVARMGPDWDLADFLAGKKFTYRNDYGQGYYSIQYNEDSRKYELDFDKTIEVG